MKHLNKCPLFLNIKEQDMEKILNYFNHKKYKKGQTIFYEGEHVDSILILVKGYIEINSFDVHGNKKMVAILEAGEIFAESVALSKEKITPFNINAIVDTEVMLITYEQFYATKNIQLLSNMLNILATKNTFLTHKIECLNKATIKERLYEVLKYYYYKNKNLELQLPYNKTQLSEYLCVSRSSLARKITTMEKEGYFKNKKNMYQLNIKYFK